MNRNLILFGTLFLSPFLLMAASSKPKKAFNIKNQGEKFPIAYEKYGEFEGIGTPGYKFMIKNRPGLAKAVGAGIFPNVSGLQNDPAFAKWKKKKIKISSPWDFVNTGDPQSEFYVWVTSRGLGLGTKQFFTADALADAGLIEQALKAYYAVLIHFPGEPVWSSDQKFVWYVGPTALSRIESLINQHPEIGYRLMGASCEIKNSKDTDLKNDEVIVNPGSWVRDSGKSLVDLEELEIKTQRGFGKVQLIQYENDHWQMQVNGSPFMVKGVTYNPTPVGRHLSGGVGNLWMFDDENENGLPDAPYDAWVDQNKNNRKDVTEVRAGDFALLQEMGANAIRIFRGSPSLEYNPGEFNKKLLRDMHEKYGLYVILGDFLGAYTMGSGAVWGDGTDYTNPVQLENMKTLVRDFVKDHRAEPYVLMWLLGNENLMQSDYSGVNATRTKASTQVKEYLEFVNEIAEMIHQLDPDHPVAVGNLDMVNLEEHAEYAPAVDIFGANSYRGSKGFGSLWKKVSQVYNRPVLVTEYGCDAYDTRNDREDENGQAQYHKGAWEDIQINSAGQRGVGNSIGGIIFEYLDEWWKSHKGAWNTQEKTADSAMAFPDGWSSEEWLGIMSQGDGYHSPFLRQPRKAYFLYRDELWK